MYKFTATDEAADLLADTFNGLDADATSWDYARAAMAELERMGRLKGDHTGEHPESCCARCDGPNVSWSAPSPLWNEVMRGGDINGDELHDGIVCPTCFCVLAEQAGIADLWQVAAKRVHRELRTVTPSGRVWNPQTWLWEDNVCVGGHDSTGEAMRCTKKHIPIPIELIGDAADEAAREVAAADAKQLLARVTDRDGSAFTPERLGLWPERHYCSGCGKTGPIRHEGNRWTCEECTETEANTGAFPVTGEETP